MYKITNWYLTSASDLLTFLAVSLILQQKRDDNVKRLPFSCGFFSIKLKKQKVKPQKKKRIQIPDLLYLLAISNASAQITYESISYHTYESTCIVYGWRHVTWCRKQIKKKLFLKKEKRQKENLRIQQFFGATFFPLFFSFYTIFFRYFQISIWFSPKDTNKYYIPRTLHKHTHRELDARM